MLSAVSFGLGTCWVELGKQIRDPDLIKMIRLPDGYEIHAPVIVGYPEKIPVMPQRKKPEIII
jgi:nitroreductase